MRYKIIILISLFLIPAVSFACGDLAKGGCDDSITKPAPEQIKKNKEMLEAAKLLAEKERQGFIAELEKTSPEKTKCNGKKPEKYDSFRVKDRSTVEYNLKKTGDGKTLVFWTEWDEENKTSRLIDAECY